MQCLILAGGLGTRMKSIGGGTPKALLQAGPHTFIDWQLQFLKILGVENVIMAEPTREKSLKTISKKKTKLSRSPQLSIVMTVRVAANY